MERIEDKCSTFVKQCIAAYSYKKQSLKNEKQLITIISELVSLVNEIEEQSATKSSYVSNEVQDIIEEMHYINTYRQVEELPLQQVISELSSLAKVIEKGQKSDTKHIATEIRTIIDNLHLIDAYSNATMAKAQEKQIPILSNEQECELENEGTTLKSAFSSPEVMDMQSVIASPSDSNTSSDGGIEGEVQQIEEEKVHVLPNRMSSTSYSNLIVNAIMDITKKLCRQSEHENNHSIDTFEDSEPSGIVEISSMSSNSDENEDDNQNDIEMKEQSETIVDSQQASMQDTQEYTLSLSDTATLQKFLPKNTVFDAIPLKEANLAILCTPLLSATKWEYIDEENTPQALYKYISDMISAIRYRKGSTDWILE